MTVSGFGISSFCSSSQMGVPANRIRASEWLTIWRILSALNSCKIGTALLLHTKGLPEKRFPSWSDSGCKERFYLPGGFRFLRITGANGQYGGLHLRRYGFGPGSRLRPVLPNGFGYYVLYSIKNSLPSCSRLMEKTHLRSGWNVLQHGRV